MTDTKVSFDTACDVDPHSEHLCYIVSQGLHLSDAPGYQALIAEPQFRCEHCRRTARARANLCIPKDL